MEEKTKRREILITKCCSKQRPDFHSLNPDNSLCCIQPTVLFYGCGIHTYYALNWGNTLHRTLALKCKHALQISSWNRHIPMDQKKDIETEVVYNSVWPTIVQHIELLHFSLSELDDYVMLHCMAILPFCFLRRKRTVK